MKIVVLDGLLVCYGGLSWEPISRHGALTIYDATEPDEIVAHIHDADAIFTNRCPISAETMARCPNLKFIGTFGTGYNAVDIEEARRRSIAVCNTPAYGVHAVAQMSVALLLEIVCNTARFDRYIKEAGWCQAVDPAVCAIDQRELFGKTAGILGMGDIGSTVANILMALGMNILATRRHPDPSLESDRLRFVSAQELFAGSDVISIHCPLNDQTRGMINAKAIAGMRDGAILINTARGAVWEEAAVVAALDSGKLYAVGSDVFCDEPAGKSHPLACHPRCVATPHVSWAPRETRMRVIDICGANLGAFLAGEAQSRIV
ncbi:MAG: NAD(P)-dependent oxidoreductase [Oscillospiraceae bacterium]